MKDIYSALYSGYIIDGKSMEVTPAEMISSAGGKIQPPAGTLEPIVDESFDTAPSKVILDAWKIDMYLEKVLERRGSKTISNPYSAIQTRLKAASKLIDMLWQKGHFRLGDIELSPSWKWNPAPVGAMAGFYRSVESLCDWTDGLGLRLKGWSYSEGEENQLVFKASVNEEEASDDEEQIFDELPFRTSRPELSRSRACPDHLVGREDSWIIYIPFDTCSFRLGGSRLYEVLEEKGGKSPDASDPDYFIDCYEVVRELVEDGIVLSGATVGDGGLMATLAGMTVSKGTCAEIGGIMKSYGETDKVRILFAEVPGVVIEIRDSDYDYVDAELVLQDVAYYPLGHTSGRPGLRVSASASSGIAGILQSLLDGQASEGED